MSEPVIVAIDGPSASGKSTVSRRVAAELGWIYVDSGSLYRAMAWHALENDVDPGDAEAVIALLQSMEWTFKENDGAVHGYIDGHYPGNAIRSQQVADAVSRVAAIPEVRAVISERIRSMAELGSLVVEGRDIGTVVFPSAPFKFYIDADPEERARRRSSDAQVPGDPQDVEAVKHSLQRRDELDSTRATAPLQVALGAEVINTTDMGIDEVVARILSAVRDA